MTEVDLDRYQAVRAHSCQSQHQDGLVYVGHCHDDRILAQQDGTLLRGGHGRIRAKANIIMTEIGLDRYQAILTRPCRSRPCWAGSRREVHAQSEE
jgi:hypothetical protein